MAGYGKVVSGHYSNSTVSANAHGQLVVNSFLRPHKFTKATVARWELLGVESRGRSRIGGVARRAGNALGSVVASVLTWDLFVGSDGSMTGSLFTVRIDWVDGRQSLVTLPKQLFDLLTANLTDRRATPVPPPPAALPLAPAASSLAPPAPALSPAAPQSDVIEQISRLALLRDQGIVTEVEFATKKAELLARL